MFASIIGLYFSLNGWREEDGAYHLTVGDTDFEMFIWDVDISWRLLFTSHAACIIAEFIVDMPETTNPFLRHNKYTIIDVVSIPDLIWAIKLIAQDPMAYRQELRDRNLPKPRHLKLVK